MNRGNEFMTKRTSKEEVRDDTFDIVKRQEEKAKINFVLFIIFFIVSLSYFTN